MKSDDCPRRILRLSTKMKPPQQSAVGGLRGRLQRISAADPAGN